MKLYLIFDKDKIEELGIGRDIDYSKEVDKYLDIPIWFADAIVISENKEQLQQEAMPYTRRYVANCLLPGKLFTISDYDRVNIPNSTLVLLINMLYAYRKDLSRGSTQRDIIDSFRLNKSFYFEGLTKQSVFFQIGVEVIDKELHLKYIVHKGIHKEMDAGVVKNDFVEVLTGLKKIIDLVETI